MKEIHKQIIKSMCKNSMKVLAVANEINMSRNGVEYHLVKIKEEYNLNPRNFYDLTKLEKMEEEKCETGWSNEKLLPCPFCGGEAKPVHNHIQGDSMQPDEDEFFVKCSVCGATTKSFVGRDLRYKRDFEELMVAFAINATIEWNKRKPMKIIVEKLEEQQNINRRINHNDLLNVGIDQAIEIVKGCAE